MTYHLLTFLCQNSENLVNICNACSWKRCAWGSRAPPTVHTVTSTALRWIKHLVIQPLHHFVSYIFFFNLFCRQNQYIRDLRFPSSRGYCDTVWLSFEQQQCLFSICRLGNKYQQTPLYLSIDWMKQSQAACAHNKFRMVSLPSTGRQRNCRAWHVHLCHIHPLCVPNLFVFLFRCSQVS